MKRINFEDGELVKGAYITINDEEIEVTEAEYTGDTPLSAYVMNKLQDNIEEELNSSKTLQGEQIIVENACSCNAYLKISGKTIQATGTPTPTSPLEIKNVTSLNFTKQNEDGTVSETIVFPLSEGQILHEGDYIDKDGIHQTKGTLTFDGTESWNAVEGSSANANISTSKGVFVLFTDKNAQICSHLKNNNLQTITNNLIAFNNLDDMSFNIRNGTLDRIYFRNSNFNTIANFKNWLAEQYSNGTPVTMEYKLAQEILIPFTEQQKTAYNKLRLMYEGYNKITCTDEIKPTLEVTYYYNNDLNKTYAKRLDMLEDIISAIEKEQFATGTKAPSVNWNDILTEGFSSIYTIMGTGTLGTGSPSGAYTSGTLITLNPKHYKTSTWAIVQIYITEGTHFTGDGYGIFARVGNGSWVKIKDSAKDIKITTGTEVETGRTINNKKEYMKRLSTGNLTSGGEKTIATGLTNITQQRPATGIIQATGQANIDIPNSANSIRIYTRLSANGANLTIGNAGDLTAFSGFVDLYYTKN